MSTRKQLTKNFVIEEFDCRDGNKVPREFEPRIQELAENLQVLRDDINEPLHVNSGFRTKAYQMIVNPSAPNSQHPEGRAADITAKTFTPKQLHKTIEKLIAAGKMKQGGLGLYPGFVHYDIRGTKARW